MRNLSGHARPARHALTLLLSAALLAVSVPGPAPASAAEPAASTAAPAGATPTRVPVNRRAPNPGRMLRAPGDPTAAAPSAVTAPGGFQVSDVITGLGAPTVFQFAADGRIFVAEKRGFIKVFDSLTDTTPTVFADLRTQVHNFWDRGLLGMALDPQFPTRPYIYILYSADAAIGGTAPRWGQPGAASDPCPSPPGATVDGCVMSGRLSRLTANGNVMTGSELVLINDWCQQFPSHSIGTLAFGPDGALYAIAGDGAAFHTNDWGQLGGSAGSPTPVNPCGDPPSGVGTALSPPTAEGGALRAQDLRTPSDPTTLDGTLIRINPDTGAAAAGNPNTTGDANARRIIAQGMRNPFRFAFRPGTSEIWLGDVGDVTWEEINRITNPTAAVRNLGWPCYEGVARHPSWDSTDVNICESLYAASGAVTAPYIQYRHGAPHTFPGNTCPTNGASISGMAFYGTGSYPASYRNALFVADYSRKCIWVVPPGSNGLPDSAQGRTFLLDAGGPIDLKIGPQGDLFYLDYDNGLLRRVRYFTANQPPVADIATNRTSGAAPLTVNFDGRGSTDADGDPLKYAWDLDGDGAFNDGSASTASRTYPQAGTFPAKLRVTDPSGASDTAGVTITVGNTPPTPTITSPTASLRWAVGDTITFSGGASDAEQGNLGPSSLRWSLIMHHCATPTSCHTHVVQDFVGVAGGSFVAPAHDYPSFLELRLTATDGGGLTGITSVQIDPIPVDLTVQSIPSGLTLSASGSSGAAPLSVTLIKGSTVAVSAPVTQQVGGRTYAFSAWSDGGAATHDVTVSAARTLTATYRDTSTNAIASDAFGRTVTGGWGTADAGGAWTVAGGAAAFGVATGAATIRLSAGQTRAASLAVAARDVDLSFTVTTAKVPTASGQYAYGVLRRIDASTEYRAYVRLRPTGDVIVGAGRLIGGTETAIGKAAVVAGLTFAPGSRVRVRIQAIGSGPTTIRARAWLEGTAEPQAWAFQGTDATAALQAAGGVGLRAYISATTTNAPVTFSFDDFLAVPPPSATLASDAFGRSVTGGWGTADLGGAWALTGAATAFSVGGGVGSFRVPKGQTRSAVLPVGARDVDVTFSLSTDTQPTGSGEYAYAVARRVNATNEYRAFLRFGANGSIHLICAAFASGSETLLGSAVQVAGSGTYAPGQRWHLRVQVVGASPTTIRARAWRDGTPEPTAWSLQATDSTVGLQGAGSVGLQAYLSGSATSSSAGFSFDDLSVRVPN